MLEEAVMIIPMSVAFAGSICLAGAAIWAGIMDLKTMRISNEIVIFLFAAYAALAPLAGFNYGVIALSFLVALGLMACLLVFFSFGWIGGGDAKLMTVIALWLGADQTPAYLLITTVLGGLLTFGVIMFRKLPLPLFLFQIPWVARLHSFEKGIPYGVAIAASTLLILPQTPWMTGVF